MGKGACILLHRWPCRPALHHPTSASWLDDTVTVMLSGMLGLLGLLVCVVCAASLCSLHQQVLVVSAGTMCWTFLS